MVNTKIPPEIFQRGQSLLMKNKIDWNALEQTHDLMLPDWGPYSPETFGLSHIHNSERGDRLDFTLLPGFYRQMPVVPDARRSSGGIPWRSSADLRRYSYRQQLEWKDRVYAEMEFIECKPGAHLLRCRLVNRTGQTRDLAVQLLARLFPAGKAVAGCLNVREILTPELPGRGLNGDTMRPGESASPDAVPGNTVFRAEAGTVMKFRSGESLAGKDLYLYRRIGNGEWHLKKLPAVSGKSVRHTVENEETVNRLFVADRGVKPEIRTEKTSSEIRLETAGEGKYLLRFGSGGCHYGVVSVEQPSFHRQYSLRNLKECFTYQDRVVQKHLGSFISDGGGECCFTVAVQPLTMKPHSERNVDFLVWNGSRDEVLRGLRQKKLPALPRITLLEPPGSPFSFSQERMSSVIMTNLVYPIRCRGRYIRNHTPGRLWNSLYTWDSGFIGLALLDLDLQRAVENLNAYLTPAGDRDNAFVLHGTPLPMQIFLFYELWNRTGDRNMLRHFYPRVRQMYDYLAGHTPGSTTGKHCLEPLICTWDYFYNSGGWDDYPPQWERRTAPPEQRRVIPAVSTSVLIRCAKFLRALAPLIGEPADRFDRDIEKMSEALRKYSWDPDAGYFSYVTTDAQGKINGIRRYADGSNYNMGLDGTSPLIAGAATAEQRKILWDKVQSPEHLWTPYGISAVDQSASYFTTDGYWNGSVWMPHQWLLWKAALNDGLDHFAEKIAATALRLWERETRKTYSCFEHFSIVSGSGMGWHHFSGLSSPVICWHRAYFEPKALTAGYDVLIRSRNKNSWLLDIGGNAGDETVLIWGGSPRAVSYCGKTIPFRKSFGKSVIFKLPKASAGKLEIR